jgi:predicted unusual protein kinase regulating ubiquinone biosynthesis (AarF/ABC1/UbiB family)
MSDDKRRPYGPLSKRRRFAKLAGMTASVAGNYAKGRVKGLFQGLEARQKDARADNARNGERIARTLGELKGAAMKIGQLASTARDILPDEVVAALTTLQGDAPPMPFEVISSQIYREFGSPPELLFERFDPEPFAAASIGQVHRARTDDGREVVCKVQYPGVDKSVDSDITHLKLALRASGLISFRKQAVDLLFAELRDRLHEELDYTNEADNVRLFRRIHRADEHLIIPDVVGERSSGRVLTLTYEPGDAFSDLDEAGYDQETRDTLGARIVDMMYRHIFELHTVHADPNPANFACRKNGDLVVYDFGCVKRVPPQVAADYKQLMLAIERQDYKRVDEQMMRLDLRVPGTKALPDSIYRDLRGSMSFAFSDIVMDFTKSRAHQEYTSVLLSGLKHVRQVQPSSKLAFTDRVQTGQHQNLMALGAAVNFHRIYYPYLNLPQLGDEGYAERMVAVEKLVGPPRL